VTLRPLSTVVVTFTVRTAGKEPNVEVCLPRIFVISAILETTAYKNLFSAYALANLLIIIQTCGAETFVPNTNTGNAAEFIKKR
jgi:hypothetical protein